MLSDDDAGPSSWRIDRWEIPRERNYRFALDSPLTQLALFSLASENAITILFHTFTFTPVKTVDFRAFLACDKYNFQRIRRPAGFSAVFSFFTIFHPMRRERPKIRRRDSRSSSQRVPS